MLYESDLTVPAASFGLPSLECFASRDRNSPFQFKIGQGAWMSCGSRTWICFQRADHCQLPFFHELLHCCC